MRRTIIRWTFIAAFLALCAPFTVSSVTDASAGQDPSASGAPATASQAVGTARYIVQLADAPLATYDGSVDGLDATSPGSDVRRLTEGNGGDPAQADGSSAGRTRIDVGSPDAVAYDNYLARRQASFAADLARVVPEAQPEHHYRVAFNGVTVRLADDDVSAVESLPGVVRVTREEQVVPLMDASLPQIQALEAWADPRVGGKASAGRGVRIAVIDSGITAEHPMFDDEGFRAPAGFPQSSQTIGNEVTPFVGEDLARFTNNKVIVARVYANPEAVQPGPGGEPSVITPLANTFHGAHVAGIAAGSVVTASVPAGPPLDVSGVAPGAYLMAYKFDNAYTPEILQIIDDAVADGADVMNNSWGLAAMHVMDPQHHPVSLAFRAASQAGVVVVAAAGNAGLNGEATIGGPFQMIDEVITVGNVQTGRILAQVLLAADNGLPDNLKAHPTQNFALGNTYDVIEGLALVSDLCNPLDALRARDRVVLVPHDAKCDQSLLPLPIELPDQLKFVESLITAGVIGAKGVALYAPTEQDATVMRLAMQGVELLLGALGEQLGGITFPVTAVIGGPDAVELVSWAESHATVTLTISRDPVSIPAPHLADVAEASTGRGPAPDGGRAHVKPDMSAPGSNIRSANTTTQGEPNGLTAASGTSMASPHVAGAAAVMRQIWPDWTPQQIKQALVLTADPVVTIAGDIAPVTVQGNGRLNLARAIDPGVLVSPPSINVGVVRTGYVGSQPVVYPLRLVDVRLGASGSVEYAVRHEAGPGDGEMHVQVPANVVVDSRTGGDLDVTFRTGGLVPGHYEGRIVLESPDHVVRVAYAADLVGESKDVLLINSRLTAQATGGPGGIIQPPQLVDTPDYSDYWSDALTDAGLSFDEWTIAPGERDAVPALSTLRQYDLVVIAAGDSNAPLEFTAQGMTSLQMYLMGGGRLLASGGAWSHGPPSVIQMAMMQNNGVAYFVSRYFAGFERTADDVPLSGQITPVRVFDGPILLSASASDDAAGNGGTVDVGRPLAELQTAGGIGGPGGQVQVPTDVGIAAPVAVEQLMPYMRTYLEVPGQGATMTGVDADATLENPERAAFIPWRAMFGGFPIEAVRDTPDTLSRAALLGRVHEWAVEPTDFELTVSGPGGGLTGQTMSYTAEATSVSGVEAVGWRWDAGDGRPYVTTTTPSASFSYDTIGLYTVRVEATTEAGHTYVASKAVRVGGIHLPFAIAPRR